MNERSVTAFAVLAIVVYGLFYFSDSGILVDSEIKNPGGVSSWKICEYITATGYFERPYQSQSGGTYYAPVEILKSKSCPKFIRVPTSG